MSKTTTNLFKHLRTQHKIGVKFDKPKECTGISSFISISKVSSVEDENSKASGSGLSTGFVTTESSEQKSTEGLIESETVNPVYSEQIEPSFPSPVQQPLHFSRP